MCIFLGTPLIDKLPDVIESAQALKARHWSLGTKTPRMSTRVLGVGNVSHDARGSTYGRHYVSRMVCTNIRPETNMMP